MANKVKVEWEIVERRIQLDGDLGMVFAVEAIMFCAESPEFASRFGSLGADTCKKLTERF